MTKVFFRANEFREQILKTKDKTFDRGYLPGFRTLDEYMSFKRGYTTYLYAFPHTGKSAFVSDILIHQAKRYNNKVAIFSPEFGKKESLIHSLVQTYVGKKMYGENRQHVADEEWFEAMDFIDNHFVVLDPPKKSKRSKLTGLDFLQFNLEAAFNEVYKAGKEYGWDISLFVIDPLNHMEKGDEDRRKQTADFVLDSLMFVNEASEQLNLHTIIVNHLRDADRITDKETGVEYYPRPYPSELLGGQGNWRAGQQMIGLHRNPAGVLDKSGIPYPENSTEVLIQKAKPHGAGKLGAVRLFFDDDRQKFYEQLGDRNFYAGEYELRFGDVPDHLVHKSAVKQSSDWYGIDKDPEPDFDKPKNFVIRPSRLFDDDNEPF